ncbi:M23 family metallopeptidase [Longirhabdus pacifica]|uniref:M23 family metallopeptidase n=1 Tax=Longirhabdus pacifica TaxID=2305227 RepID=UPI001008E3C0|nr:M23 family metallopeptidase [Longirhabdus pacifica]
MKKSIQNRRRHRIEQILNESHTFNKQVSPSYYKVNVDNQLHEDLEKKAHSESSRSNDPEWQWKQKMKEWGEVKDPHHHWFSFVTRGMKYRWLVSIFLYGIIWIMFQFSTPIAMIGQNTVKNVLYDDGDLQRVTLWYEQTFGSAPSILPVYRKDSEPQKVTTKTLNEWNLPVIGSIHVPFSKHHYGIEMVEMLDEKVRVVDEGRVLLVNDTVEWGNTVVVQHSGNIQSIYGYLEESNLKVGDWVSGGDVIGTLKYDGQTYGPLFIAMKQDETFIDPAGVIPFD